MSYVKIVDNIRDITSINIPVYFNSNEANCIGTPYFGVGHHIEEICPAEVLYGSMTMFDSIDFIENKHINLYHIGLPDKIIKDHDRYVYTIVQEQLNSTKVNIKLDEKLLEAFIILHEFGHAHELFVAYNKDVEQYIKETNQENDYITYMIKERGLAGTDAGLRLHKSSSTEHYADNFALKHFKQLVDSLKTN